MIHPILSLLFLLPAPDSLSPAAPGAFTDASTFEWIMDKPLFPASGPATSSFNGLHPESNFIAIPNS